MVFDEQALKLEIEKTWGQYGAHADVYRDLLKRENDYKLMLNALANGWEVERFHSKMLNEYLWLWTNTNGESPYYHDDSNYVKTTSDIPEINDELREEFKKI